MIVGIGVDIVEVERLSAIISRQGDRFLKRVYTDREVAYARGCAHPEQRFASRFAAKEAVLKALGTGWTRGVSFRDVEVTTDDVGAPSVAVMGRALDISRSRGIARWHISLSHDHNYAIAHVVAETREQ